MPTTDPLGTALRTLIAGTDAVDVAAGLSNAVAKTVVIDSVTQQGHVAIVDFGRKFESANTRPQVGQVVYTLTQFPGIDQVQFLIDGQPNGATGVPPWSRGDLADMTPAILVLSPAPADALATTFSCQGLTQLTVPMACVVLDAQGHRVATTAVARTHHHLDHHHRAGRGRLAGAGLGAVRPTGPGHRDGARAGHGGGGPGQGERRLAPGIGGGHLPVIPTNPSPSSGWPPPIDLTSQGLALAWGVYAASFVVAMAGFAALVGSAAAFPVFLLGLVAAYATIVWRARQLRTRALAALVAPEPGQLLAVEVALIKPGFQPLWARPRGVLLIGQGRIRLWPVGLDLPVEVVRPEYASMWGKGGIYLDRSPVNPVRITFVARFDPAVYWARLVNRPACDRLAQILAAEAARAVAGLPTAGWYPDPGGSGQARWWDGRGWSAELR